VSPLTPSAASYRYPDHIETEADTNQGEPQMKPYDYVLLVLAALVLAAARIGAPHTGATATANGMWAPYGIDLSALTRNAGHLPEEEFPAH